MSITIFRLCYTIVPIRTHLRSKKQPLPRTCTHQSRLPAGIPRHFTLLYPLIGSIRMGMLLYHAMPQPCGASLAGSFGHHFARTWLTWDMMEFCSVNTVYSVCQVMISLENAANVTWEDIYLLQCCGHDGVVQTHLPTSIFNTSVALLFANIKIASRLYDLAERTSSFLARLNLPCVCQLT
jgi:hypothetical protein